jgi:hypothetical protein
LFHIYTILIVPASFQIAPDGNPADDVGKLPNTTLPLAVSIALKSAAAVRVGLTYNPRVIPFAPPVWLMVFTISNPAKAIEPLVGANVEPAVIVLGFVGWSLP